MTRKIANTKASDLSIQLVKLTLRQSDTTSYQQAAMLRYAARKKIPHDALAEALAKKGNGIAEWAARFSKEFGTKRQAAAGSSDIPGRSIGPADDEGEADDANYDDGYDLAADDTDAHSDDNQDYDGNEDDATSDHPDVYWGPKALKKWRKSEVDGGAWLFVQWLGENRARIMKKSRPK